MSPHALANMDLTKLEREFSFTILTQNAVWDLSNELSYQGAKQIKLKLSSQVKSKLADLIECQESGTFRQYTKLTKPGGVGDA